jgi:hypothetical protein
MSLNDFAYAECLIFLYLLIVNLTNPWLHRVFLGPFEGPSIFEKKGRYFYISYFRLVWTSFIITVMYSCTAAAIAVFIALESKRQPLDIDRLQNYMFIAAVMGTLFAVTARIFMLNEKFKSIANGLFFQMLVLTATVALFMLPLGPLHGALGRDIFIPVFESARNMAPGGYIVGIVSMQLVSVLLNEIIISRMTNKAVPPASTGGTAS